LEKNFKLFEKVKLEEIADVRRSQLFKDEGEGEEVYEISPSDFSKSGFTLDCGKIKQIGSQYKRLQTYKLEPYDVLLSTKGTIGKVAIIGETNDVMIASQAIQVIRLHDKDKKEKAVALYMFLKSEISQTILSLFVSGSAMPQVATSIIKNLPIPLLSQDQQKKLEENFNKEVMLYKNIEELNNKIKSIHTNFLGDK
jgi:type I restriction enzyme M protein